MNSNLPLVSECAYNAAVTGGASLVVNVGHADGSAARSYVGGSPGTIDGAVTDSADIDNPTWVNFVSLSGFKGKIYWQAAVADLFVFSIATAEAAGNALRYQIVRDGVVIFDVKGIRNAGAVVTSYLQPTSYSLLADFCFETSFVVMVARKGSFTQASSVIKMATLYYEKLE